jgi:hypothetical protein
MPNKLSFVDRSNENVAPCRRQAVLLDLLRMHEQPRPYTARSTSAIYGNVARSGLTFDGISAEFLSCVGTPYAERGGVIDGAAPQLLVCDLATCRQRVNYIRISSELKRHVEGMKTVSLFCCVECVD